MGLWEMAFMVLLYRPCQLIYSDIGPLIDVYTKASNIYCQSHYSAMFFLLLHADMQQTPTP